MDNIAFLMGTGPSLNEVDVKLLKDKTTISFNRSYIAYEEWGFVPTYYMAIDSADISSYYHDINNLIDNSSIKEFFISNDWDAKVKNDPRVKFIHNYDPTFWNNAEQSYCVAFRAVALLYEKGFRKIALLGCDSIYNDVDPARDPREKSESVDHFRKDYYRKGILSGPPPVDKNMLPRIWGMIQDHIIAQNLGLKIYSCTRHGILNNTFDFKEFDELLRM